ncbi:peroxide stress protein YaaA [Rickettsiales bacterium]|nr:peroxide stress protein YaaA [Rickettsiales bacterium]
MLFVISPAKSLDLNIKNPPKHTSIPDFLNQSNELIKILKEFSTEKLSKLMNISEKLAILNQERYQDFNTPFNSSNSYPALFVFNGDVYNAIKEEDYNQDQLDFAQNNLRILSGLYGILRPLDLMQPYRLEMGTRLDNKKGNNLYKFWQEIITNAFNKELKIKNENIIVNLASSEYSKAINLKLLNSKLLNINFLNKKGGDYKNIGIFAKRARGLMSDFIIQNQINNINDLKSFNRAGYLFDSAKSDANNWFFLSK